MDKEKILKDFINRFCIPTIHGVQLDPEKFYSREQLKEKQGMVDWLKDFLNKLDNK